MIALVVKMGSSQLQVENTYYKHQYVACLPNYCYYHTKDANLFQEKYRFSSLI